MNNKLLTIIIVILVAVVACLAFLNQSFISNKDQSAENPELIIKLSGTEKGIITLNEIKLLGEQEFTATLRSSGKLPEDHTYKGVPLINILKTVDNDIINHGKQVVIRAIDGYVTALPLKEVLDEDNVYLVYYQDRKPLGSKRSGGSGPLMTVVRKDRYGQRWCKFAVEVDVR
jgi:hypothetical protein